MFSGQTGVKPPLGLVHEGDHVPFPSHRQCVVQNFIKNVVRKCPWSQSVMLIRFDNIFVVVHNRLQFLFNCVGDLGCEPNI